MSYSKNIKPQTINEEYLIVEFSDGVQLVPTLWLTPKKKNVYWPRATTMNGYYKFVERKQVPEPNRTKEAIVILLGGAGKYYKVYLRFNLSNNYNLYFLLLIIKFMH